MNKHSNSNPLGNSNAPNFDDMVNKILGVDRTGAATPLSVSQQALRNDRRIENMAIYKVTNGYINIPPKPNPFASFASFQPPELDFNGQPKSSAEEPSYVDELAYVFGELKGLVMRGSFTLDQLEDRVYAQYGIVSEDIKIKAGIISKDKQLTEEINNILGEEVE